jgi:predicted HAD superfamily Cof-like phosphohydrolase
MTSRLMNQVQEFHNKFDVPVACVPTLIPSERSELRLNLIEEEFTELIEAVHEGDIVGIADALADLSYVISGAAHEFGIPLDAVIDEVHRSNMTKVWSDGTVHRREDGKILKPPTYSPANVEAVLAGAERLAE